MKRIIVLPDDGQEWVAVPKVYCFHCKKSDHTDAQCWSTRACTCGAWPHKQWCGMPSHQAALAAAPACKVVELPERHDCESEGEYGIFSSRGTPVWTKSRGGTMEMSSLVERLQRIESRLVRGFSELGVRVTDDEEWFKVNKTTRELFLKSSGKSIASIWIAMRGAGCVQGVPYKLHINGEVCGTIILGDRR